MIKGYKKYDKIWLSTKIQKMWSKYQCIKYTINRNEKKESDIDTNNVI